MNSKLRLLFSCCYFNLLPGWNTGPVVRTTLISFPANLEPIFKTHAKLVVPTLHQLFLRLDYCFGGSPQYNITMTVVADDQKSGFASYGCKKTYNGGKCNVLTPYRDISGGAANFIEMDLDGPVDYGPVVVIVSGQGRSGGSNSFILTASAPY